MNNNGKEFNLWVNSKAPMDKFGDIPKDLVKEVLGNNILNETVQENISSNATLYHGDGNDAKFIPDETASSRLFMYMHVDTEKGTVSDVTAGSFGTENLKTHEHSMAKPICGANMWKGSNEYSSSVLSFKYSGGNPDPSLKFKGKEITPNIDVQGQLRFSDDKNGDLLIQGKVYGDGFPATSMFAHFGDTKVMLAGAPIGKDATLLNLSGGPTTEIMNINLSIEFKDDTPVRIKDWNTMKAYSVKEWNTLHESTPMIESEHSREKIIDKGEPISQLEVEQEFLASSGVELNIGNEEQMNNQDFDSTLKAQEIVANMDLPQRDEGMDYGMNDGMDYC